MVVDLTRLERDVVELHDRYASAEPFPHIVVDDFLDPDAAKLASAEFPSGDPEGWLHFVHVNERKFSNTEPESWGRTLQSALAELNSPRFLKFLSALTGIEDLIADETLEGGGLHRSVKGGYLNIHADFTVHPRHRHWRRRVNLLLYLNEDWPAEYGGDLEFWSTDMKRCVTTTAPVGNRAVIFTTNADSYHGHPEPLRCPDGVSRRSLALYYFTEEDAPLDLSTNYRARPGDGPRSLFIYLDKKALKLFDWMKRRLGLSDEAGTAFLERLDRLRSRFRK
jgi:hypothetical protein